MTAAGVEPSSDQDALVWEMSSDERPGWVTGLFEVTLETTRGTHVAGPRSLSIEQALEWARAHAVRVTVYVGPHAYTAGAAPSKYADVAWPDGVHEFPARPEDVDPLVDTSPQKVWIRWSTPDGILDLAALERLRDAEQVLAVRAIAESSVELLIDVPEMSSASEVAGTLLDGPLARSRDPNPNKAQWVSSTFDVIGQD